MGWQERHPKIHITTSLCNRREQLAFGLAGECLDQAMQLDLLLVLSILVCDAFLHLTHKVDHPIHTHKGDGPQESQLQQEKHTRCVFSHHRLSAHPTPCNLYYLNYPESLDYSTPSAKLDDAALLGGEPHVVVFDGCVQHLTGLDCSVPKA